jgi:hypothetical protein
MFTTLYLPLEDILLTYLMMARKNAESCSIYRGADKSVARPGREQATATEDFDVLISYL